ncbi:MAG: HNH endonuclease signature motif containing protein [Eubacteriales bacterium]
MSDNYDLQKEGLATANIVFTDSSLKAYLAHNDIITNVASVPIGYKVCTKCGQIQKLYLFNKNKSSKDGRTSQCKECQKQNARKSYKKNRTKKKHLAYYQEHKEERQEKSRQYYLDHKEERKKKHAAYRSTKAGQKAMKRAHSKRAQLLKENTGIPYTRVDVLTRDCLGGEHPVCYLCGEQIHGTPHLDHVVPVVMHGKDCFTNIACVHDTCNLRKSKDAREITTEMVLAIEERAMKYIDEHPEKFPSLFETPTE